MKQIIEDTDLVLCFYNGDKHTSVIPVDIAKEAGIDAVIYDLPGLHEKQMKKALNKNSYDVKGRHNIVIVPIVNMIIEQDYDHFIASFKQQFNMDIASYKQDRMRRRIDAFISRKGFENYTTFLSTLRVDQNLFLSFIDYITINVSEFLEIKNVGKR